MAITQAWLQYLSGLTNSLNATLSAPMGYEARLYNGYAFTATSTLAAASSFEVPTASGYAPRPVVFPTGTYNSTLRQWQYPGVTIQQTATTGFSIQYDGWALVMNYTISGVPATLLRGYKNYTGAILIPSGATGTIPIDLILRDSSP